ncbi:uncharacterized protein LY89DRAFT_270175 [Mollisia scopiformis]|uniref:4-hydroxy-tetrahydrodipicolinate synthase n=1 Tax=Mollisia scopiformis TaxID=149040 RepID=A0A132BCJ8_MOLSC|nr:uncharacterized protein LY89DRAFT_270175 [Mollisia scopiformis]KUJ10116.1 hypothetical protein LY89DRAFT_270175 [Mollisia scopiformis]
MAPQVSPGHRKAWTRSTYRGIENLLFPSFGPDLQTLDEDAIRRDVRFAIANGCFSTLFASLGHPVDVAIRALEVACEEASDQILVGTFTEYATVEDNLALVKGAAAVGCSHMLIMYPPAMTPKSEDEVYTYLHNLIAATDIGIVLYAAPHKGIAKFSSSPSGVALDVLDKLAGLPTVSGQKLTQTIDPILARECCVRFGDRLTINCVAPELMPLLGREFDLQWSGEWSIEGVQSPDKPFLGRYVGLIAKKDFEAAEALYWKFYPAYKLFSDFQIPKLKIGSHPWQHLKYYQWLTGGNGGLASVKGQTPEQIGILTAADRQAIRQTFKSIGVKITNALDDEFIVGVENARRGVKASEFLDRPYYE